VDRHLSASAQSAAYDPRRPAPPFPTPSRCQMGPGGHPFCGATEPNPSVSHPILQRKPNASHMCVRIRITHMINKRVWCHNCNQTYESLTDTIFIYYTQTVDTKVREQTITKWATSSSTSTSTWLGDLHALELLKVALVLLTVVLIWTAVGKGEHSYGWSSASGGNMQDYQG
jgi:hypothetical protein